jgi:type II secretory pathway pseudopilin PulG
MSRVDAVGFTLIELLVSMIAVSVMMLGLVQFFLLQNRTYAQQDQALGMEENLRLASSIITDSLRAAGYAAPSGNPSGWINWVSGMNTNPKVTVGGSSATPDTLYVAGCFREPVATLSVLAAQGVDAQLVVTPTGTLTDDLNTGSNSLIQIGESEFARVTGVSSTSITIDTDLGTIGNQPVGFTHSSGAEICRVDVTTFSVANDPSTGVPRLLRDDNQGAGPQPVAEGISNFKITIPTPPKLYRITLTARSEKMDPLTRNFLTRPLVTDVTLRN